MIVEAPCRAPARYVGDPDLRRLAVGSGALGPANKFCALRPQRAWGCRSPFDPCARKARRVARVGDVSRSARSAPDYPAS